MSCEQEAMWAKTLFAYKKHYKNPVPEMSTVKSVTCIKEVEWEVV